MKKTFRIIFLALIIGGILGMQELPAQKVSSFPELTAATSDDLLLIVDTPGTHPTNKKITVGNFLASIGGGSYQPLDADLTAWAGISPPVTLTAGDIWYLSSGTALTRIPKGNNNSILAINNAGNYTWAESHTHALTAAPAADDSYSGIVIALTAGEALDQWDLVYCKNKAGVHACYKYDADGADKLLLPQYIATTAVSADASGFFLVLGAIRNDGWSQTTNQDEGKPVFASTTAGGITLTEPVTAASEKVVVGYVLEENKIRFIQPRHYPILTSSFVIPAPAATDDINIMKAPRALNILSSGISCIVQGTTSVTGQLQECDATGGSCADLDSDIVCDADGAVDDGSLTDSSIASGAWLRWKTTSVSGSPTFLTVTFQYRTAGE